jgi:hypothetical protein
MMLSAYAPPQAVAVQRDADRVVVDNGRVRLAIDRKSGLYGLHWSDGASIQGVAGEVRLSDGRLLKSTEYPEHDVATRKVKDGFGEGVQVTVRHRRADTPEIRHVFWVYANRPEALVRLEAVAPQPIGSNYLAPIVAQAYRLASGPASRSLYVPYDNDGYSRYRSDGWEEPESYEVGAAYDDVSRHGIVVGSVDHDLWKSAVQFRRAGTLTAYAGAASQVTRDKEPHGTVTGREIRSPRLLIGAYADWRDGMERYGDANAIVQPPLPWRAPVPFGWNSWSGHKAKLNAADAKAATEFIAEDLPTFRTGGTAYVNLDSFWDNLKKEELQAFVARAHAAGLKAGIYWTPFTAWGELDWKAEGKYTFQDLAMKDAKGQPLPKISGGWPLDPTHPGMKMRIDRHMAEFVAMGYDFIKLDFMTHGAVEGKHFDPKVATGTAAYIQGMRRLLDAVDEKKIGRPFFVSLSIAPLFPHGLAHSRRISCDAFADIGASEYLLNSATYSWWTDDRLYRFNDPDHSVVYQAKDENPTTESEGKTRLTASAIAGGMLLEGDDLTNPKARERARRLFGNRALLDLARLAVSFRPVDGDSGSRAGESFVHIQDKDTAYVAVFNYDREKPLRKTIPLARLGLTGEWSVHDLWTGREHRVKDAMSFELPVRDCVLVRLARVR